MSFYSWRYNDAANKKTVITSSGELQLEGNMDIESAAVVEVKSGGEIEVESGGILDIQTGAQFTIPSEVLSTATTGGALQRDGVSVIKSTRTADAFTLAAPLAAGVSKTIVCSGASATGFITVTCGTGQTFDGTNYIYKFLKASLTAPSVVQLVASATNRWYEVYRTYADGTALASTST